MNEFPPNHEFKAGGIVLCGGKSSRMGQAKAWLPFGDEFMLQRVVRIIGEVVDRLVVVAAPGQALPALPTVISIVRDEKEGCGPLQGLAAGLQALTGHVDCSYLSSCDVPLLRTAFVKRMISLFRNSIPYRTAIVAPRIGGRIHPLAGVYSTSVLSSATLLLTENRLRLTNLLDLLPTRFIEVDEFADVDPDFECLQNLNTPDDYKAALRMLKT